MFLEIRENQATWTIEILVFYLVYLLQDKLSKHKFLNFVNLFGNNFHDKFCFVNF